MDKQDITLNLYPNVIEGAELKELFQTIFHQMAYYVSKTYGPFGENTGYQNQGKILCTKDGWTVEQELTYSKNMLANVIRKLIIDVSHSINIHVGDGTTTGVIAANEINKLMMDYKEENQIHTKFLSTAIQYCVEKICMELRKQATPITKENMDDIIYRIAEVSLDWDKEFAGFIRDIYHETENTVIRVKNSGYESSYVEYMNGYDLPAKLISEFKINETATKKCKLEKPIILIFSYTVNGSMFDAILTAATYFATTEHRELVVLAPDFEKEFRDTYNSLCIRLIKTKQPLPNLVLARYFTEYNIDREMLNDLSFLLGAGTISRDYNAGETILTEFARVSKMVPPTKEQFKNEKEFQKARLQFNSNVNEATNTFKEGIKDFIGTCDTFEVDDKLMIASGFNGLENSEALKTRKETIQADIDKRLKDMTAKSMYTDEVKLKTVRLGKLKLKSGIINVGGFGDYNLKSKRDALDDAINACSNAYLDGVITGGGVAIPVAIDSLLAQLESGEWNPAEEKGTDNIIVKDILSIIRNGFTQTWNIMLMNRYKDGTLTIPGETDAITTTELINRCIVEKKPWNLITQELDDTIIHPVKVETEVVKGCLHLVLTTTTTNQLFYNGFEGVDKELEGMREVKVD